jgi:hypothetical protein
MILDHLRDITQTITLLSLPDLLKSNDSMAATFKWSQLSEK